MENAGDLASPITVGRERPLKGRQDIHPPKLSVIAWTISIQRQYCGERVTGREHAAVVNLSFMLPLPQRYLLFPLCSH